MTGALYWSTCEDPWSGVRNIHEYVLPPWGDLMTVVTRLSPVTLSLENYNLQTISMTCKLGGNSLSKMGVVFIWKNDLFLWTRSSSIAGFNLTAG